MIIGKVLRGFPMEIFTQEENSRVKNANSSFPITTVACFYVTYLYRRRREDIQTSFRTKMQKTAGDI
jgi:hypothetical protein